MVAALSACDLPLGLGLPTTRSLERGAIASLAEATSLEIIGSYVEGKDPWSIDLKLVRPGSEQVTITNASLNLEAIILEKDAYFRGQQFLSTHMGKDAVSRSFVKSAGNGWWKGSAGHVPQLSDLTDDKAFSATFLGQAVTERIDHLTVDGVEAIDLSGPRADVFIAARAPFELLRLRLKPGAVIDGVHDADFRFLNYNSDFQIAAPADIIDFSNLSTLPPIYTVLSVDISGCASPCAVSALVKNLGGMTGAQAPSSVTFTLTDTASRQPVGSCQALVVPDVGYNATTTAACSIDTVAAGASNAIAVRASPENPGP